MYNLQQRSLHVNPPYGDSSFNNNQNRKEHQGMSALGYKKNQSVFTLTAKIVCLLVCALLSNAKSFAETNNSESAITIDLSTQTLTWKGRGQGQGLETRVFSVSTGKPSTPTPVSAEGKPFKIDRKEMAYELKDVKSKHGVSVKMPYWMSFISSRGIAIHGVNNTWIGEWPGSGACIRMKTDEAKWLFEHVDLGCPVVVKGSIEEYFANNAVFPWQKTDQKILLEEYSIKTKDGVKKLGYKFKKNLTPEMAKTLLRLVEERKLKIYRPLPSQIKADPRWKNGNFVNFPGLDEMGNISTQAFEQCKERYFTLAEFQAAIRTALGQ